MVLYLLVWSVSPPMDIDLIYRIIALGCAVGWFLIGTINRTVKFDNIQKLALVFMLLVIVISLIENSGDVSMMMKPIMYYILVLGYIMNDSYQNRWKDIYYLIPLFIILMIVFNIITFKALMMDPTLARKIIRADESVYPYIRSGVGGYTLEYVQVFLFPVLISWISAAFKHHKVCFIIGIIWMISYILLILNSGYSIGLMTTAASLIVLLLYKRKSIIPALLIAFALIVLTVILIGYADSFRNFLLNTFDGTKVASKVSDIYESIHGSQNADSVQSRFDRYWYSIRLFLTYPGIGSLWFDSGGGHSFLLDTFAKYGVWGGAIAVKLFYCVPAKVKKTTLDKKDIVIANAFFVSLITVTLLDSMPYNMVLPVLIVAPVLFEDIQMWRKENESPLDRQPASA